jgi:hypothetical protein
MPSNALGLREVPLWLLFEHEKQRTNDEESSSHCLRQPVETVPDSVVAGIFWGVYARGTKDTGNLQTAAANTEDSLASLHRLAAGRETEELIHSLPGTSATVGCMAKASTNWLVCASRDSP